MPFVAGQPKTGGRKRNTPNKRTSVKRVAERLVAQGETPLDFLSRVYRDEAQEIELRVEAARAAAPYVHPRLASVDLSTKGGPLIVEIVKFGAAAADQAAE